MRKPSKSCWQQRTTPSVPKNASTARAWLHDRKVRYSRTGWRLHQELRSKGATIRERESSARTATRWEPNHGAVIVLGVPKKRVITWVKEEENLKMKAKPKLSIAKSVHAGANCSFDRRYRSSPEGNFNEKRRQHRGCGTDEKAAGCPRRSTRRHWQVGGDRGAARGNEQLTAGASVSQAARV